MWGFSRELCETDHLQYHKQIVLMCCSLKGFAQSMCSSRICHKQLHCNSWARAVPRTSVFKKSREGFALARTVLTKTPDFGLKSNTKEDPLPWPGPFQGFPALMEGLRWSGELCLDVCSALIKAFRVIFIA